MGFHFRLAYPSALPLHPVNPDNACSIRITAAAGTYLAGASYSGTVISLASLSSLLIELYIPKYFFTHAASLHQSFLHCAISPTAASRRSLGRVSVPMWPSALSGRLLIVALVSRYLTNWLIRRGPIPYHRSFSHCKMPYRALMRFYQSFPTAIPRYGAGCPRVTHPSATQSISLPPEGFRLIASFDLHVLGTPPAFILSQDRTLSFISLL